MMNKYRSHRIDTPSGPFDSKKEYKRYVELKQLEHEGTIQDLQRQVPFELIPKQVDDKGKVIERSCKYIADFVYTYKGTKVVEDTKGYRTPDYIIKRKLLLKVYGIRIREI